MLMPMAKPRIGTEIGEKLRQVAVARGLSQGQVAANAHVSQPTVSALFNGGTFDPPISTLLKIAKVLSVSIDELVGLKPLRIPEAPTPDGDLRQQLEDTRRVFRETLERLGRDFDDLADRIESSPSRDTQQQKPARPKRSA